MPLDADFKLDEAAQKLAIKLQNQVRIPIGEGKLLVIAQFSKLLKNLINLIDKKNAPVRAVFKFSIGLEFECCFNNSTLISPAAVSFLSIPQRMQE